jgi:hypothetical protein
MAKLLSALILVICFLAVVKSDDIFENHILKMLAELEKSLLIEVAKATTAGIPASNPFCDEFPFCNGNPFKQVITVQAKTPVPVKIPTYSKPVIKDQTGTRLPVKIPTYSEPVKTDQSSIPVPAEIIFPPKIPVAVKIPVPATINELKPIITSITPTDCSQPGSFKTCNVLSDTISGGTFVGRKKRDAYGQKMKSSKNIRASDEEEVTEPESDEVTDKPNDEDEVTTEQEVETPEPQQIPKKTQPKQPKTNNPKKISKTKNNNIQKITKHINKTKSNVAQPEESETSSILSQTPPKGEASFGDIGDRVKAIIKDKFDKATAGLEKSTIAKPEKTSNTKTDCSQPGNFKTCNVLGDTVSDWHFVGRKKRGASEESQRLKRLEDSNTVNVIGGNIIGDILNGGGN